MTRLTAKTVDDKGRLTLGKEYAHQQFLVRHGRGGVIEMIPAETVPAREAWLFSDPKAISRVMEGLRDAREGRLADRPDLDEALTEATGDDECSG